MSRKGDDQQLIGSGEEKPVGSKQSQRSVAKPVEEEKPAEGAPEEQPPQSRKSNMSRAPEPQDNGFADITGGMGEAEAPEDEKEYQDHFRRTFITTHQKEEERVPMYSLHDIMIPAGRTAKLVRLPDPMNEGFRISEVCDKLKFVEAAPVIILSGSMGTKNAKVLAGIARAAFRAGATIIDSGIGSGIEKFCMRKDVPLVGVCPEAEIAYPKINPTKRKDNELTNGHTHFFLLGDDADKTFTWGQEAKVKTDLALRIAKGRSKYGNAPTCKVVTIVLGENPASSIEDIKQSNENCFPCIFLQGSALANDVIVAKGGFPKEEKEEMKESTEAAPEAEADKPEEEELQGDGQIEDPFLKDFADDGKFFICKSNSEDIANIAHLALTITLLDLKPPAKEEEGEENGEPQGAAD